MGYSCPFCDKVEPDVWHLRTHIRRDHFDESLTCPACGYKAKSLSGLIYHAGARNDVRHQAIYYLAHKNTRGTKAPYPIRMLKELKEVFRV